MASNMTLSTTTITTAAAAAAMNNHHHHRASYGSEPTSSSSSTNTTFVQADPSTFRAIVQKLTGAPHVDPSTLKVPLNSHQTRPGPKPTPGAATTDIGARRPAFKLHERRRSAKKLQLKLNNVKFNNNNNSQSCYYNNNSTRGFLVSPVSTLDFLGGGGRLMSPTSPPPPCEAVEEEERAIAENGFYLHSISPKPPELLPLFPLNSPRDDDDHDIDD